MKDCPSGLTAYCCCAWSRYIAYTPCSSRFSSVRPIRSLATSPACFPSSTLGRNATVSLLLCDYSSFPKLPTGVVSCFVSHLFPGSTLARRSCATSSSCLLCFVGCSSFSPASSSPSPFHRPLHGASRVRALSSLLSRAAVTSAFCSSALPCSSPAVPECSVIYMPPPIPSHVVFLDHLASPLRLKSSLKTPVPFSVLGRRLLHTEMRIAPQPLAGPSFSVCPALPRALLSAAATTAVAVLGAAAASGAVAAAAAAAASAAAAAAAIPAVTSAGDAVANTAISAAATVAGGGVLFLVSSFLNSQLYDARKLLPSSSCSTSRSHRGSFLFCETLRFSESPSRSAGTRVGGLPQLCGDGLLGRRSSIFSASVDLSSCVGGSVENAWVPSGSPRGRCATAGCLKFSSLPSSLQDFLAVLRRPSIAVSTSYRPHVAASPVPVGPGDEATTPSDDVAVVTDLGDFAGAASRTVATVGAASAEADGSVAAAGRRLISRQVASRDTTARRSSSVVQGLRELLEELTIQFWKGNEWKGPQKNKWKWYHRHGYWATRKKLIDFTKYRRYGYHERYGMGRPKMKFWEDPSRYKRLRQAVRFW